MRTYITSLFFLTITSLLSAQSVSDQVSLSANYDQQVWYSMENGEVATADNTDWDIAFFTDGQNSSILLNDHINTSLYLYGETADTYNSVDTAGFSFSEVYNNEVDWTEGAFKQFATNGMFDYGWGEYNPVTHLVDGNKTFIVKLSDGTFKKFFIQDLNFGTYNFKYADLDGSNEVVASLDVTPYSSKNFVYYSMQTQETIDREPASDSWDLTFTRFDAEVAPAFYYLVTGAQQNIGVEVAQADDTPVDQAEYSDFTFSADKNIIGDDWKYFDMETFQYVLVEDLSYFVQSLDGDIYHMAFTGFGGQENGNIDFTFDFITATSIQEEQRIAFGVYPNPVEEIATVVLPVETTAQMTLRSMSGAVVARENWTSGAQHSFDVDELPSGMYMLEIRMDGELGQQRLIIR